jgi:hypothetical protein
LECEENEGNMRVLQCIQNILSVRKISTLQLHKISQRGCPLYAIQVLNAIESKELKIEDHPLLWEFRYVFQNDIVGIPPTWDLDLSIDLVPGAVPTSKLPYIISTVDMVELKVKLKYMMDKR